MPEHKVKICLQLESKIEGARAEDEDKYKTMKYQFECDEVYESIAEILISSDRWLGAGMEYQIAAMIKYISVSEQFKRFSGIGDTSFIDEAIEYADKLEKIWSDSGLTDEQSD